MAVQPGPSQDLSCIREAVCINTRKIFDSCKDKDCIEDLRVYLTRGGQECLERASSVKSTDAELLYVYIDVETVPFNRGFYTVDVQYFYKITADLFICGCSPVTVAGLAVFNKKVMMFGSEGSSKVFSSTENTSTCNVQQLEKLGLPIAVVEAVDPMVLDIRIVEVCDCRCCDSDIGDIPPCVCESFEDELVACNDGKRILATIGQFSIIRLERDTQLLIPSFDYCIPDKECAESITEATACEVFNQIKFPLAEFFPPSAAQLSEEAPVIGTSGGRCCK